MDDSPARRVAGPVYQVVALLAMLAHLLIVGPFCLLTLGFTGPSGADVVGLVLKAIVVAVWIGLGYLGLRAWDQRSWWVVAVPVVALCIVFPMIGIFNGLGWYMNIGY
jgi:hypothetical protein